MGETISKKDIKLEQKDNKIQLSENKLGIPDAKVVEKMNRLALHKISSKGKNYEIMNSLNKTPNTYKYIKN